MASIPVTKEQFENAVLVFAHYLGINIEQEESLLEIAKNALLHLPYGWELGIGEEEDNAGIPYFFNTETEDSVWQHPAEKTVVRQIREERKRMKERASEEPTVTEDFGRNRQTREDKRVGDDRRGRRDSEQHDEPVHRSSSRNGSEQENQAVDRSRSRDRSDQEDRGRSADRREKTDVKAIDEVFQKHERPDGRQSAQLAEDTTNSDLVEELEDFDAPASRGNSRALDAAHSSRNSRGTHDRDSAGSPDQRHGRRAQDRDAKDQAPDQASSWSTAATAAQKNVRLNDGLDRDAERGVFSPDERERERGAFSVTERGRDRGRGAFSVDERGRGSDQDRRWNEERDRGAFSVNERGRDRSREQEWSGATSANGAGKREADNVASPAHLQTRQEQFSSVNSHVALNSSRRELDDVLASPTRPAEVALLNESMGHNDVAGGPASLTAGIVKDLEVKNKILQNNVTHLEMYMKQLESENEESKVKIKGLQRELEQAVNSATKAEETHKMEKRTLQTSAEQELVDMKRHYDRLLHDTKIEEDSKGREALRRAVADREEDLKFRLKAKDREHGDALSAANLSLTAAKRQCSEFEAEVRSLKTRVQELESSSESQQSEVAYKQTVAMAELEDKLKASLAETKRLREDHVQLSSKLTSAMQMSQIAVAEAETAKMEARSATVDNQTSQHALTQAVQRLHSFENETVKLKATVLALTQENEQYAHQVRKFQAASSTVESQLTDSDGEIKRFKLNSQAEIARLSTRVLELESYTKVQRKQIDSYALAEDSATRDLQTKLDRAEYDAQRLRERCTDGERKHETMLQRLIAAEKELQSERDILARMEKMAQEDKQRAGAIGSQQQAKYNKVEEENEALRNNVSDLRVQLSEAVKQHRVEMQQLQREVSERIPQLTEKAVARVEAEYEARCAQEVAEVKSHYESIIKRRDLDNMESLSLVSEKESRHQVARTELQYELENVKMKMLTYKRKADDLEAELESKTREARKLSEQLEDLRERIAASRDAQAQAMLGYGDAYRTPMLRSHSVHGGRHTKQSGGSTGQRGAASNVFVHSDDSLTVDESNDENMDPQSRSTAVRSDMPHPGGGRHGHRSVHRDRRESGHQASESESILALHEELKQMRESFTQALSQSHMRSMQHQEAVVAANTSAYSDVSNASALVPRADDSQHVDHSHMSNNASLRGISMLQAPSADVSVSTHHVDHRNTSDLTAANTITNSTHVLSPTALETLFHSPVRQSHHVSGTQARAVAAAVTSSGANSALHPTAGRHSLHYSQAGVSSRSYAGPTDIHSAVRSFPGLSTSANNSMSFRQGSASKTPKTATYPARSPYKSITGSRSTVKEDIIFNTDIYDGGFHEGYWRNKYSNSK